MKIILHVLDEFMEEYIHVFGHPGELMGNRLWRKLLSYEAEQSCVDVLGSSWTAWMSTG